VPDCDGELIEMKVQAIVRDDQEQHVVVLRQGTGEVDEWVGDALPIVVGPAEARAIHTELKGVEAPRPMTHDLMRNALHELDAELTHIVVSDLREDVFYATIWLTRGEHQYQIDARPSDAIALALRAGAPIYVAPHVHDQATVPIDDETPDEEKRFRQLLGGLRTDDEAGTE
jgi:bifunctional DNase/RNase